MKPFDWIPDQGWEDIMKLKTVNSEVFESLPDDIEKNEKIWKEVTHIVYVHVYSHTRPLCISVV